MVTISPDKSVHVYDVYDTGYYIGLDNSPYIEFNIDQQDHQQRLSELRAVGYNMSQIHWIFISQPSTLSLEKGKGFTVTPLINTFQNVLANAVTNNMLYGTSKNVVKFDTPGMINWLPIENDATLKKQCTHEMRFYQGILESYNFCVKCDYKDKS